MDLRQLRYFIAIAEHGNFHRAAEALNIAQSALSRHMQTLGAELGSPLFERSTAGVRMTTLGKVFYAEARDILERADQAVERSRNAVAGKIGRLSIGVNEIAARHPHFIKAIAQSRLRYPEVELLVERINSPEQVAALAAGKLDLGVMIDRPMDPKLGSMRFCTDRFLVGMHPRHELTAYDELTPAHVAGADFISMRRSRYGPVQTQISAVLQQLGVAPQIVQEAANEQMQLALIAEGLGIGMVTESTQLVNPGQIALRPLRGLNYALNLDLVWRNDSRAPALGHLLEIFTGILKNG